MVDISNFVESDRYTLYDVIIMQSKKDPSKWYAKKKFVSLKEIEDQRFDALSEEVEDGRPITTGYLYIYDNNIDKIEDIKNKPNSQQYELTILRNDKGEKIVEKGVKVTSRKEVICVNVSPIRKTKEKQRDYCFLTVSFKEEEFDKAGNRAEIIEGFRKKGLDFQEEPHRGYYQFNTLVFPMAKQIPMFNSIANKTLHLEVFIKEKENKFDLNRVGRAVFESGPLKAEGIVSDIIDKPNASGGTDQFVEITVFTSWDKLRDSGGRNLIHFVSEPRENLAEPTPEGNTIKLKFEVRSKTPFKGEIGDDIAFEMAEDNVKKLLTPKISYDFNKESGEAEEVKVGEETSKETSQEDSKPLPF